MKEPLSERMDSGSNSHDGAPARPRRSTSRVFFDYALTAALAIAVALVVQAYVIKPYRVPTPSMANTIQPGDRVLIDRVLYGHRTIDRGDIVVFEGPRAVGGEVLLKRVVGLPGDRLEIRDGVLFVNGRPADDVHVLDVAGHKARTEPGFNGSEQAPGWSLLRAYVVPEDRYYLMGDNREDSYDSRFWGPVPREAIIGEARAVYWPLDGLRTLD
jgi:signal peptidase I